MKLLDRKNKMKLLINDARLAFPQLFEAQSINGKVSQLLAVRYCYQKSTPSSLRSTTQSKPSLAKNGAPKRMTSWRK